MSEFERQNEEAFSLVRENRRRCDLAPVIGYIVTEQQAKKMAVDLARSQHPGVWTGPVMMAIATVATIILTVAALVG